MTKTVQWKRKWEKQEAKQDDDGIWTIGRKLILPKKYFIAVTRWFHDKAHGRAEVVADQVWRVRTAPWVYAAAKRITSSCQACQKFSNPKQAQSQEDDHGPIFFSAIARRYADKPAMNRYMHLLVVVDQLSGWVKPFQQEKQTQEEV